VQILRQQALLDFNYYHTLLKQRKYTIDEDVVRTYFPLAKGVKDGQGTRLLSSCVEQGIAFHNGTFACWGIYPSET